jgi:hypothetical protein
MDVNILKTERARLWCRGAEKYLLLAESEIKEGDKRGLAGALFERGCLQHGELTVGMKVGISSDWIDISMRRHYG